MTSYSNGKRSIWLGYNSDEVINIQATFSPRLVSKYKKIRQKNRQEFCVSGKKISSKEENDIHQRPIKDCLLNTTSNLSKCIPIYSNIQERLVSTRGYDKSSLKFHSRVALIPKLANITLETIEAKFASSILISPASSIAALLKYQILNILLNIFLKIPIGKGFQQLLIKQQGLKNH